MAFDVWPVGIPNKALVGTYSERVEPWTDSFQVEEGPPMEGPSGTMRTDLISYEIILDNTDRAALMTFYQTTLEQGVKYFTTANPEYGGTETYKFAQAPEVRSLVPGTYRVSVSLRRFH